MSSDTVSSDILAGDTLTIQSHRGPYDVVFGERALNWLAREPDSGTHVLVDERVAELHGDVLSSLLSAGSVHRLPATETQKSLEQMPAVIQRLLDARVRRGHRLIAVGGGIMQDITCFVAATLLRGLEWRFVPTTLLAQADSCIGSKSSINVAGAKNVVGTYTPPAAIYLWPGFLETLAPVDVRSGIGEMLKVHAIDGPSSFDAISRDYTALTREPATLLDYIRRSLAIKQRLIERDEFDQGPRNVLNYGHSFGHAIESATDFGIPHGVAITIGMDMANFVAVRLGRSTARQFERMHETLRRNYSGFEDTDIPVEPMLAALRKDKKNSDTALRLILPNADALIEVVTQPFDDDFRTACLEYLARGRA